MFLCVIEYNKKSRSIITKIKFNEKLRIYQSENSKKTYIVNVLKGH